jgi:hypothetical protein
MCVLELDDHLQYRPTKMFHAGSNRMAGTIVEVSQAVLFVHFV